jgi:hypothetical protein
MLKLPAHRSYPGVGTVYADDEKFYKFYVIPDAPRVRLDKEGKPVFLLTKFKFADGSDADPDRPKGGGYLAFDSELALSPEQLAPIRADLEQDVRRRWEELKAERNPKVRRLKFGAVYQDPQLNGLWSGSGMAGGGAMATPLTGDSATLTIPDETSDDQPIPPDPPPVVFADPMWTSGTVTLQAPQSPALVVSMSKDVKASLVGSNVAAFAMDLTAEGATFMQQVLVGDGGSDLTPLSVRYDLEFVARLPPATTYIHFRTLDVYHATQELFHEHDNCSDDYFTSEKITSQAIAAGVVTVKVDTGAITDPTIVQSMQQQATNVVETLLKERFAKKERAPLESWGDDVADSSDEVYRLKQISDIDATDFTQTIRLDTATKQPISPQGTLQTFFAGVDEAEIAKHVREVDLDDPFFHTLDLEVRAFARWKEDEVAFVEVEIKYEVAGELKTRSFTFTPDDAAPKRWDPALIQDKREYSWRWRYAFVGRAPGEWKAWEKRTSRDLNVSLDSPGLLDVEVTGVGIDFANIVDAVLVHMRYEDPVNHVPLGARSLLLTKDKGSGTWQRRLYGPWARPLDYRVEYLLQTGTSIDTGWQKTDGPSQNLLVTRPKVDQLDVKLLPAGPGWDLAIQSVASLRYADGDYHRDAQFAFKSATEFKEWSVVLLNPAKRAYELQVVSTFKNGDVQQTEWLSHEDDGAIPVIVEGPPRVKASISGLLLDFASTPVVEVTVQYNDPSQPSLGAAQTFSLQADAKQHVFTTPRRADGPRNLRYKVTYFPLEGPPVERDWKDEPGDTITVERYSVPRVGAEFVPALIDFAATPVVEVDVAWNDPTSGQRGNQTLTFTDKTKQSWFMVVPDTAARAYTVEITYFLADGSPVKTARISTEKTSLTIPRYKPTEA